MFKFFIKNYNVNSIVTYSDKRFFTGDVYTNIGMHYINTIPVNYHYFNKNNGIPIDRLRFQKHKLKKIYYCF